MVGWWVGTSSLNSHLTAAARATCTQGIRLSPLPSNPTRSQEATGRLRLCPLGFDIHVTVTSAMEQPHLSYSLTVPTGALKVNMLIWLQSWLKKKKEKTRAILA